MEEQRRKPILKVVALLAALGLAMACGVVLGGGGVYLLTEVLEDRDHPSESRSIVVVPERGQLRLELSGVTVIEVVSGSPADRAGLSAGDRILAVDGQELGLERDLGEVIAGYEPGDRITLKIERDGGDVRRLQAKLAEHADREGAAYLGVRYRADLLPGTVWDLPERFRDQERFEFDYDFDLPRDLPEGKVIEGTRVVLVVEDGPAFDAGLRKHDVITAVGGEPVASAEALVDAIGDRDPGDRVRLSIYRPEDGEELEIDVVLGRHPERRGRAYLGVEVQGYFRLQGSIEGEMPGEFRFQLPFDSEDGPHFIPPGWLPGRGDT
jgi:hypothetical protein